MKIFGKFGTGKYFSQTSTIFDEVTEKIRGKGQESIESN